MTHYVRFDAPRSAGPIAMALCGTHVHPTKEHANDPACPTCRRLLDELDRMDPGGPEDRPAPVQTVAPLRISTTTLEAFRLFRDEDWMTEDNLLASIKCEGKRTREMAIGIAFENVLMNPSLCHQPGMVNAVEGTYRSDGFMFDRLTMDRAIATVPRGAIFQVKATRRYQDAEVVAKIDAAIGSRIDEWKTTTLKSFNADKYLESYQWRFELDIFTACLVRYSVFLLSATNDDSIAVRDIEHLSVYPYAGLHTDCAGLVEDFVTYARRRKLEPFLVGRETVVPVLD